MIDTIKIFTNIPKNIYDIIKSSSIIKTSYHSATGEVFYNIVNDKLEGSYDSSLSVRVGEGIKYKFTNGYYIEIEGSYHKISLGYNALNGYYNLYDICEKLISMCNLAYNIKLPDIKHWFLQRVDIAKCFDLKSNLIVCKYINNLSFCNYPRQKLKHFNDESIYLSGTSTTLKIYNKLLEFKKHDMKKLNVDGFNILEFIRVIDGFIRFECEIKKQKLESIYNKKYIRIKNVSYKELEKIWSNEFMKLLKLFENDIKKVRKKEEVEKRLKTLYKENLANRLYDFYMSIMCDGLKNVKSRTSSTTYYRNLNYLKEANIDLTQSFNIDFEENIIDFDPFSFEEVI